ncbi:MAG TPA: transcriptional regulator [Dokdonella sp.]|uniref:transcriptional regulator n=1 Tax=Dokdonella sp. TaxID=2291710 RepID=UPI002CB488DF|nr:transcriptional regulator [Dokdonella sp.]HUD42451.1 transcriptional regulator [Dokdonella sp.]
MSARILYRFGDFLLCPATREFRQGGVVLPVPARVFDCLVYLIEHRDRAVGRDELGAAVWGRTDVSEPQLTQAILRARRLLGEGSGQPSCIRTIPKFGYRWACEVSVAPSEPDTPASVPAAPASGEPVVEASAAAAPADAEPKPRLRWRTTVAALAAILAALALAVIWREQPAPAPSALPAVSPSGALVVPVEVGSGRDHAWVRLGAMDIIAQRLRAAGLAVAPSETTLALLAVQPAAEDLDALARRVGASWIVASRADRSARGWRVGLRATDAGGRQRIASGEAEDVLTAVQVATDALLAQIGLSAPPAATRDPAVEEVLQRAQAAMLENDLEGAARILTDTPLPASAQPELRYQLASLAHRAGRLDEAARMLQDLLDDESAAADGALRGRIHYGLGAIAMMRDGAAVAEQAFEQSLQSLDRERQRLDYGKALAGRGGARLTLGRVGEGLDDLGEARVLLEQAGDRLALARLNLNYGIALLLRDRPAQAVAALTEALNQLEPFGALNERAHGYSALVNARLALLDLAGARAANEAARALLARIGDPLSRAEILIDRAALLIADGRYAELDTTFETLAALGLADHARLDGRRDALRARWAWDRGDAAAAADAARAAVAKLAASEPDAAAEVLLLGQRALLDQGRGEEAAAALAAAAPMFGATLDGRMPIGLRLARAELAAATGQPSAADEFAAAQADADARDVPAQSLAVAVSIVPYLLRSGRAEAASAVVGRLPAAASDVFEGALLQVRIHQALGHRQTWAEALQHARSLAGARPIPVDLQSPPSNARIAGSR